MDLKRALSAGRQLIILYFCIPFTFLFSQKDFMPSSLTCPPVVLLTLSPTSLRKWKPSKE